MLIADEKDMGQGVKIQNHKNTIINAGQRGSFVVLLYRKSIQKEYKAVLEIFTESLA